jgi:hypothetical protein
VDVKVCLKEVHELVLNNVNGTKVFNSLLQSINNISNNLAQFKSALKNDLLVHAFYSAEEYFDVNRD